MTHMRENKSGGGKNKKKGTAGPFPENICKRVKVLKCLFREIKQQKKLQTRFTHRSRDMGGGGSVSSEWVSGEAWGAAGITFPAKMTYSNPGRAPERGYYRAFPLHGLQGVWAMPLFWVSQSALLFVSHREPRGEEEKKKRVEGSNTELVPGLFLQNEMGLHKELDPQPQPAGCHIIHLLADAIPQIQPQILSFAARELQPKVVRFNDAQLPANLQAREEKNTQRRLFHCFNTKIK